MFLPYYWGAFMKDETVICQNVWKREKLITNLSLTLLSVANTFDIILVWKSNEYIYLVKLNVINLTCTEPDQTLVCSGI